MIMTFAELKEVNTIGYYTSVWNPLYIKDISVAVSPYDGKPIIKVSLTEYKVEELKQNLSELSFNDDTYIMFLFEAETKKIEKVETTYHGIENRGKFTSCHIKI